MATMEDLRVQEADLQHSKAHLASQLLALDDSIAHVHMRMAEVQDINRNAITYNLPNETLSAIFEAGLSLTYDSKQHIPFEILVSTVSRRWRHIALQTSDCGRTWT